MAARPRRAGRRVLPANLYRNKVGYLWYRNPETGKAYGLGYDEDAAINDARAANAELARKKATLGLIERMNGGDTTVAQWCDQYLEIYTGRTTVENSVRSMASLLKRIKSAPFANKAIALVTPTEINGWLKALKAEVSATYSTDLRYRLTGFFNEAIAEGLLKAGENPVAALRKARVEVSRERLTLEGFQAVLKEARKSPRNAWAARAFLLALLTGQRREDIGKMAFKDVRAGFLYVEQGKSQGRTRLKIPVSIGLTVLGLTIEDVIKECRDAIISPWVIHHVSPGGRTKPGAAVHVLTLSGAFKKMREAAKIKADEGHTPPTFHEIRSLAARLYTEQYGAEFAQALLGHKSAEMTALYRDSRGKEWTEVRISA